CLWVVCGGLLASYFLQQNRSTRIAPSDGAIVGLLAGVIGAFVQLVLSIPIGLVVGPMERQLLQRLSELSGRVPNAPDMLGGGAAGVIGVLIFSAVTFVFTLTVGSVVSAVAGAVGAALFGRDTQATFGPSQ